MVPTKAACSERKANQAAVSAGWFGAIYGTNGTVGYTDRAFFSNF
ncbi:hypothetical protein Hsw_1995 [Hymenobacter swuensis DY53]|uniref:Uncharacterized protein n=1 Tax=Hymenobacter swuensis DY53 TaxID=1227739 RepID=W8F789_9BACT|nr:hypothetical protein Hsw_1995 [Hymenobacter swuensis DY53]